MHMDIKYLRELLEVLKPNITLGFSYDYSRQMMVNTHAYFQVCQRILSGKKPRQESYIFKDLFREYKQMFKALDKVASPMAKVQLTNKLYTFFSLYDKYYGQDYNKNLKDVKELENMGIDFLKIISSLDMPFTTEISMSDSEIINSIRIYSDGTIINPKVYRRTHDGVEVVGCQFNLEDASYVLQSYPSLVNENGMSNYLSVVNPDVDIDSIRNLPMLDTCDFEFTDDVDFTARSLDDGKMKQLSLFTGQTPQNLYKRQ